MLYADSVRGAGRTGAIYTGKQEGDTKKGGHAVSCFGWGVGTDGTP